MANWLIKSDPDTYSWEMLLKDKKTNWDGVRNYQARNNIRLMKKGDLILVYHSQEGAKEVKGIAKVSNEAFADPTSKDPQWLAFVISPVKSLKRSVSLSEIKNHADLKEIGLIKQSRLSVMPLTESEFNIIVEMSGTKIK